MKLIAFYNVNEELNKNNVMFEYPNAPIGDDLLQPMIELKNHACSMGIDVATVEACDVSKADVFIFMDMPSLKNRYFQLAVNSRKPMYLILFECEIIKKDNYDLNNHQYFSRIFTHNDHLVDNKKYIKINFSFVFPSHFPKDLSKKKHFCTLIASNKRSKHSLELYSKRIEAIHWFEKNHPEEFDLYGIGWHGYRFISKKLGEKLDSLKVPPFLPLRFPSYRGRIEKKRSILEKYKFSICYENARDIPGYITEKIFDCFFAGCIPIYWGANNVAEHIPEGCFVDKREYGSYEELYEFMCHVTDREYLQYLDNIEQFLKSDKSYQFSSDYFVKTILSPFLSNNDSTKCEMSGSLNKSIRS